MRLGIFGGTFNPIHFGHLRAAEEVCDVFGLDKVLFLPSGVPPLKDTDLTAAAHRYAMTAAATQSNGHFDVSDLEVRETGKSYTVNTLGLLSALHPRDALFLILGMDAFLEMPLWWQPETLVARADFIVVSRPGYRSDDIAQSPYVRTALSGDDRNPGDTPGATPHPPSLPSRSRSFELTSGRRAVVVPVTPLDISSTEIRRLARAGRSIKYLVPESVEAYIVSNALYRG